MRYQITRDYIRFGQARSGQRIEKVRFIVSHDTGNPGSTAYDNRNYFDSAQPSASSHTFIDDKTILEIIPLHEKAWHVRYNVREDNERFGFDANDAAIGVELCYGGTINFQEAYDRYVWYHAYLCDKFGLNPDRDIVAHSTLDPTRRTDPQNAFRQYGVTWTAFINEVKKVLAAEFKAKSPSAPQKGAASPVVRIGDRGEFVREIQEKLIKAGFPLPAYGADGIFGEETKRAVTAFQKHYRLATDGIVGPQTLAKLSEVSSSNKPVDRYPLPDGILKRGDRGLEVRQLQRALKYLRFDPKYVDGIYGPLTENAVYRFQSMYAGLKNDGIYGPNTKRYMLKELTS